mmetsp:Transcript_3601/g.4123  ORF Transcript_3601/g.4123 Transcript_3601/m.4123 type:complete len:93 (+) Transcript_3601:1002-1280(+)
MASLASYKLTSSDSSNHFLSTAFFHPNKPKSFLVTSEEWKECFLESRMGDDGFPRVGQANDWLYGMCSDYHIKGTCSKRLVRCFNEKYHGKR